MRFGVVSLVWLTTWLTMTGVQSPTSVTPGYLIATDAYVLA